MTSYYNENDPRAAAWLRELIKHGHIAPGDVDERSIRDVSADDLRGYVQCHFFAGIGVWSYALRRAGWPDDRPVWTGSCPCQPFSSAGQRKGVDDDRHLWPVWFALIAKRNPRVVFGEQVASKDGLGWLDLVHADLEGAGYACGALDLCAAGFGAPHIRQRLYFVADAEGVGRNEWIADRGGDREGNRAQGGIGRSSEPRHFGVVADSHGARLKHGFGGEDGWRAASVVKHRRHDELADADSDGRAEAGERLAATGCDGPVGDGSAGGLANAKSCVRENGVEVHRSSRQYVSDGDGSGCGDGWGHHPKGSGKMQTGNGCSIGSANSMGRPGPTNGFWGTADWLLCRDGKWRPVEPGTFPLADRSPARVGRLRGYGNAIVAPQAEAFIEAYLQVKG